MEPLADRPLAELEPEAPNKKRRLGPIAAVLIVFAIAVAAYAKYYWMRGDYLVLNDSGIYFGEIGFLSDKPPYPLMEIQLAGFSGMFVPGLRSEGFIKDFFDGGKPRHDIYLRSTKYGHYILQDDVSTIAMVWKLPAGSLRKLKNCLSNWNLPEIAVGLRESERHLASNPIGLYLLHRWAMQHGQTGLGEQWRERLTSLDEHPAVLERVASAMEVDRLAAAPGEEANRRTWNEMIAHIEPDKTGWRFTAQYAAKGVPNLSELKPPTFFIGLDDDRTLRGIENDIERVSDALWKSLKSSDLPPQFFRPDFLDHIPTDGRTMTIIAMTESGSMALFAWAREQPWVKQRTEGRWNRADPFITARLLRPFRDASAEWQDLETYWNSFNAARPFASMRWAFYGPPAHAALYWKVVLTNTNIARLAIQANHYRAIHGNWPTPREDGAIVVPELPTPLPPFDPFGDTPTSTPLRTRIMPDNSFRIYSIGPDRIDDNGDIALAAGAGPTDKGDIVDDLRP